MAQVVRRERWDRGGDARVGERVRKRSPPKPWSPVREQFSGRSLTKNLEPCVSACVTFRGQP
jgi:hypothetical protein